MRCPVGTQQQSVRLPTPFHLIALTLRSGRCWIFGLLRLSSGHEQTSTRLCTYLGVGERSRSDGWVDIVVFASVLERFTTLSLSSHLASVSSSRSQLHQISICVFFFCEFSFLRSPFHFERNVNGNDETRSGSPASCCLRPFRVRIRFRASRNGRTDHVEKTT